MEKDKSEKIEWFPTDKIPKNSGIAHVIVPLYKLGLLSEEEYKKRIEETPES